MAPVQRKRRVLKWLGISFGGLLLLLLVAIGLTVWRTQGRVRAARAELADLGVTLDLTQLAKPPVPDEDNAAPLYRRAFDAVSLARSDEEFACEVAWGQVNLEYAVLAERAWDIIERNRRALELLHKASTRPQCNFELDWSDLLNQNIDHFRNLRCCARLLAFESAMFLHSGRADDAVAVCAVNLRLADAADEPLLIAQLLRYAIIGIGSKSLETVLSDSRPSEQACRRVAGDVGATDLASSYVEAMEGEAAHGVWMAHQPRPALTPDALRAMNVPPEAVAEVEDAQQRKEGGRHNPLAWLAAVSYEASYMQVMIDGIRQAERPYRELASSQRAAPAAVESAQPASLEDLAAGTHVGASRARDRAIAALGVDQIALLLKAYRARHGRYPATLEQLQEYAGYELPLDPFSGEAFVYRREGKGFLIYSWGPNLKDDGGQQSPTGKYNEGDIVFRCPA